jgi:hypothetical protein
MTEKIQHYDPDGEPLGEWYPGQFIGWSLDGSWAGEGFMALPVQAHGIFLPVFVWNDVGGSVSEHTSIQSEDEYHEAMAQVETVQFFMKLIQSTIGSKEVT